MKWSDGVLKEYHNNITDINFMITSTKRSLQVVTFSIKANIKFLEHLKQGFKRAIPQNIYGSKITTQLKNSNLDYMIDSKFTNVNRLFFSIVESW